MRRHRFTILLALAALGSSVGPIHAAVVDDVVPFVQPDGTHFPAHVFGDEFEINWVTADGYAFVHNEADGYLYYAELDDEGDFQPSEAKVGIDDPLGHGIQKNLQRSAACRAKIQAERIAHGYARQPLGDTGTAAARVSFGNPDFAPCTAAAPCDVYVVMVGFEDQVPDTASVYAGYDQPWGYPMALFNQFFNGGYDNVPAYTGPIAHTAADTTNNLTVFGSLRAYFHQVHGEDILRFHILNDCEDGCAAPDDQPIWIQLPETKQWYATAPPDSFWAAAESTAVDILTLPADFPYQNAPAATQLANKVLYLYAGVSFTELTPQALHPRVNVTTTSATVSDRIGARYVMSERQGFGWTSHSVDRFAGIGLHIHEIGHLFGFHHPKGTWEGTNPHTYQTTSDSVRFTNANLSGWGVMADGAHGPPITSPRGNTLAHRACPAPYNPFYRMDLGWNTRHDITATTLDQRIDPSPDDFYVVPGANGQYYILEFRTAANFGQYTGGHRFTSSPGLLIWRRAPSARKPNPMLIPADGRSIFDARPRPIGPNPDVPTWQDRLSDPFGAIAQLHGPTVTQATDATHLRHETVRSGGNRDPGADSHLAFRNIRNNGDHALVDIYTNYWSGPITGSVTWSDTVYVGGDITVPVGDTLTISPGTLVRFTANSDDQSGLPFTDKSVIKVNGTLVAEGTAADSITFESDAISPAAGDWGGIAFADSSVDASCKVTHAVIKHATYGIYSSLATPAELNHNTISECSFGIMGLNMTDPTIQNNVLDNNLLKGLYLANVSGAGEGIKNNTMTNNGTGLYLSSSTVHIHNSIIDNNTKGAHISSHTTSTLDSCTFKSNDGDGGWGIYAFASDPVLKNCEIANNNTYGLRMYGRADPVMNDTFNPNDFSSNGTYELYLQNNCQPILDHPIFALNDIVPADSGYAVYINQSSSFNKLKVRRNWWGSDSLASPSSLFSPADSIVYRPYSEVELVTGTPANPPGGAAKVATDSVELQLQRAKALERTGQLIEAAEQYRSIVTGQPDHPLARHALSRLYSTWRNSGRDMAAMAAYCAQIEGSATSENMRREARDWRLRSWLDAGRITEAMQGYRAIAAATPDSPEGKMARINIADTYHHYLGDLQAAKNAYQAIAADFPGQAENELAQMVLADIQGRAVSVTTELPDTSSAAHPSESLLEDGSTGVAFETRPNPANPSTTFRFSLPRAMQVELRIYNVMGQKVRTLVPLGLWPVGEHNVAWDGKNSQGHTVGSGIYVANLRAGEQVRKRKLMILK